MLEFLTRHQKDIMMILGSMCAVISVFVLFMKALPKKRRDSLLAVEICSMLVGRNGFEGWDYWKKYNRDGYDCCIEFEWNENTIVAYTENAGISIKCKTELKTEVDKLYVSITGDQIALTNIRAEE